MATKLTILCSASLFAMTAYAAPAAAQDQPAPGTTTADDSSDDTIVVTGIRSSLRSAQSLKENAVAVTDSIVAEDIGKLPDNTVSDALQRVTGVQVARQRRGGHVLIRGPPT